MGVRVESLARIASMSTKRRYTLFKRLINAVSAPVNVNISKQ